MSVIVKLLEKTHERTQTRNEMLKRTYSDMNATYEAWRNRVLADRNSRKEGEQE